MGAAEPETNSAPRRWSAQVGRVELRRCQLWTLVIKLSLPALDTAECYRRPRDHQACLEHHRARRRARRHGRSGVERRHAHTDTLLNSAAQAMSEISCTGITSTQPVGVLSYEILTYGYKRIIRLPEQDSGYSSLTSSDLLEKFSIHIVLLVFLSFCTSCFDFVSD